VRDSDALKIGVIESRLCRPRQRIAEAPISVDGKGEATLQIESPRGRGWRWPEFCDECCPCKNSARSLRKFRRSMVSMRSLIAALNPVFVFTNIKVLDFEKSLVIGCPT